MSDLDLARAFDALELLLQTAPEASDPQAVADWHETFKAAVATAERGPQWSQLQARGQALLPQLNDRVAQLQALQATVKQQMESQGAGRRALSAYSPVSR